MPCNCRGFAKRTLLKTARRAGIKTKDSSAGSKRSKYVIPTPPMIRRTFGMPGNSDTLTGSTIGDSQQFSMFDDDLSGSYYLPICLSIQFTSSFNELFYAKR
jgi:hypothetical protein